VTTDADLKASYGEHDWKKMGWPPFQQSDPVYAIFYKNAIAAIKERQKPGDMLLCSFGNLHQPVADAIPTLTAVEPGIGYPSEPFAKYRVFESYAVLHAYQGQKAIENASNSFWYDAVIPNSFDLKQFKFQQKKEDYFLFLGRINGGKGAHIVRQLADATNSNIVVAGAGDYSFFKGCKHAVMAGVVGPELRQQLLSKAKAVLCPSTFLEPFCGVQIEAMLSGTPVISSDWGAFAEYNIHGQTGYRCRTFEHFIWAAKNIEKIYPDSCRAWGVNFSLEKIAPRYTEYLTSVQDVISGKGWYTERPDRTSLHVTN
jgi:glycosyltransferase involved in cell wall biosynthesis